MSGDLVFSPKTDKRKNINIFDSIFDSDKCSDDNSNKSISPNHRQKLCNFNIFAENSSDHAIHFNKNQLIGFVSPVDQIKTQDVNKNIQVNPQCNEAINLIQPSPDVLKLRREEFHLDNFKLDHLIPKEKQILSSILEKNFAAFSTSLKSLGHTDLVTPEIKLTSKYPIKCLPFPIPQALQAEAKRQLQQLIDAGIIERNLSNWACPMLLVKKKSPDNKSKQDFRLALDLRLVNTIIEGSSYPLPKIQDLIAQLAKYTYFTSLDMPSAYHQIHLPEKFQDIFSFATPWATFKFLRLVFGLKTAAQYFQSMADVIIEEVDVDGLFAYQDDFMSGSKNFAETCEKLNKILKVFIKYNLTLNPKKCQFHQAKVQYLGFEISQNTISPITSNIVKINSFPQPKSKKHVKRLLGVCGYYRHLIPAYAHISAPLVQLTSPKVPFKWETAHHESFQKLQHIFFNKPFLIQPDFSQDFYLNTDASSFAISAILMQKRGEDLLPISYFSRTLKNAETRYPAIQLELMAIVKGIQAFKYYLFGRKFYVLSDSKPLDHYYTGNEPPTNLIARWLMFLEDYDYELSHVPGKYNVLADYFSRTPFPDRSTLTSNPELLTTKDVLPIDSDVLNVMSTNTSNTDHIPITQSSSAQFKVIDPLEEILTSIDKSTKDPLLEITNNTILFEQLKDPKISIYYRDIILNKSYPALKFFQICKSTKILLYKKNPDNEKCIPKIAMPLSLRPKALRIAHVPHYGIQKTFQTVSRKYYWKGIFQDTENHVQSCSVCITSKNIRIPQAPFQNNPIPEHPGEYVSLDLVGPFRNNLYILTIIDRFSRFLQLYPLKSIASQCVIQSLFTYISTHGRPAMIHTDLGTQFTSQIFNDFNLKYGIRLTHSSVAHPQCNAISERINQSIKATILALQQDGYSFENAVRIHQMMYNSSLHSTTKFSPNCIHFGRELSSLYDVQLPHKPFLALDNNRHFFQLMEDLDGIYKKVYDNLQIAQKLQNDKQHQKAKLRDVKVGDLVYIKSAHTFNQKHDGPFKVIRRCGPVNILVQRANNPAARQLKVHIDRVHISKERRQHLIPDVEPSSMPVPVRTSVHPSPVHITMQPMSSPCPVPSSSANIQSSSMQQSSTSPVHSSDQSSSWLTSNASHPDDIQLSFLPCPISTSPVSCHSPASQMSAASEMPVLSYPDRSPVSPCSIVSSSPPMPDLQPVCIPPSSIQNSFLSSDSSSVPPCDPSELLRGSRPSHLVGPFSPVPQQSSTSSSQLQCSSTTVQPVDPQRHSRTVDNSSSCTVPYNLRPRAKKSLV